MATVDALSKAAEEEWLDAWKRGPTRTRWTSLPPQVGDTAPDLDLPDDTGRARRLGEFWRDGVAIVMFWRHFGCGCGLDRAKRLVAELPEYEAAGARVVVVGQGEPERAAAYKKRYAVPVPVLADADYRAYDAFGVLEGTPAQLLFDAPEDMQRVEHAAGERFQEMRRDAGRPPVDNPWLLPAEFVVDARGVIRLAWRYNHCEDFPDPRVLVAAVRDAKGR